MKKKIKNNGHGGKRSGSGRPPLPTAQRRKNVTVKMFPKAAKDFTKLAKQAKVSKGGVIEWLVESKEAAAIRKRLTKKKSKSTLPFGTCSGF